MWRQNQNLYNLLKLFMMKKRMYLALASVMMTLGVGAQVVEVNPAITYQTIADFGASDCWTAEYVGKYFNESEKA